LLVFGLVYTGKITQWKNHKRDFGLVYTGKITLKRDFGLVYTGTITIWKNYISCGGVRSPARYLKPDIREALQ